MDPRIARQLAHEGDKAVHYIVYVLRDTTVVYSKDYMKREYVNYFTIRLGAAQVYRCALRGKSLQFF